MTKDNELLPCPFCGGEAEHNDGGRSVYGRMWWEVWCYECGISFADREVWIAGTGKLDPAYPAKECITKWNTRAPQT